MILLIRLAVILAVVATIVLSGLVLLALVVGTQPASAAGLGPDGTPLLIGQSRLTTEQLTGWWNQTGQTSTSTVDGPTLIGLYADAGQQLGVRADLAIAQAALETGYFQHFPAGPGGRNNFAGIAVYDGQNRGAGFPTASDGVAAHVALLREFADPDFKDAPVHATEPGCCPTVGSLTGVWATDPSYATTLLSIYDAMLAYAGVTPDGPAPGTGAGPNGPVTLATVSGITVAASIAPQIEALLADSAAAGLRLSGGGYRSADQQIATRRNNCGPTNYDIYEKPSSQCSPPTARPGRSQHEQGLAIDFTCNGRLITSRNACWQWLNANAARYGMFPLRSELWHLSTTGS